MSLLDCAPALKELYDLDHGDDDKREPQRHAVLGKRDVLKAEGVREERHVDHGGGEDERERHRAPKHEVVPLEREDGLML